MYYFLLLSVESFCCTAITYVFYNGQIESLSWVICGKSNLILVGNHRISLQKKISMDVYETGTSPGSNFFRFASKSRNPRKTLHRSDASHPREIIFDFRLPFASHKHLCFGFLSVVSVALLSGNFRSVFGNARWLPMYIFVHKCTLI